MGKEEKMISCKEPACGLRVSPDIHHKTPPLSVMAPSPSSAEGDLAARQPPPAHTDRSNIPFAVDETPTPSRYIRHHYPCEDLFEEVCGGLNPFDEQFRRASQARTQPLVLESSTPHIIEVSSRFDPDHQSSVNSSSSNHPDRTRNSSGTHHHHNSSNNSNGHPIIAVSSYNSDDESLDTPRIVAPPIPADSDHTISSTSRDDYHFPHHHHRGNYHNAPPPAAHYNHHHHNHNYHDRLVARDSSSNADVEEDCVECGGSYASSNRRHGRDGEGSNTNQYRVTSSYLSVPKALPFRSLSELSARMFGSHVTINEDGEEVEGDETANIDRKRKLERQDTITDAEVQIDDEDDQPGLDVFECEVSLHSGKVSNFMRRKIRRTSSSRTTFSTGNSSSVRSEDRDSGFAVTLSPVSLENVSTNGSVDTDRDGSTARLHDDHVKRSNKSRNCSSSGDAVTSGDDRTTTNSDQHYQPRTRDMTSSDNTIHQAGTQREVEENHDNAIIDVLSSHDRTTSSRCPLQHDETEASDSDPFKTASTVDRDTPSVMAVDGGGSGGAGGGLVRRSSGVGGGRSALSRHRLSINVTSAAEAGRSSTSTITSTPTPVITAGPSLTQCLKESTSSIEETDTSSRHRLHHHHHHNSTRSPTTPPPSHSTTASVANSQPRQPYGGDQYHQDSNYHSRNDTSGAPSDATTTNTATGPLALNTMSPSSKANQDSFPCAASLSSSSSSFWADVGYHRKRTESSSSSIATMEDSRTGAAATVIAAATALPPASPSATVLQLMLRLPNGQSIPVEIPATPLLSSPSSSVPSTPTTPASITSNIASPRHQQQQPSLAKMRLKAALTASQHASRPMPRPPPSRAHTAHRIAAMTRPPPQPAPSLQIGSALAIKPNLSSSGSTVNSIMSCTTTDSAVSEAPPSHSAAKSNRNGVPAMPNFGGSSAGAPSRGKKRSLEGDEPHGDKRLKFLERNRAAAVRCREKKKEWVQRLAYKSSELASVNGRLQTEVAALRAEVAGLKTLLLQHRTCPVTLAAMTAQQQQGGEQDSSSLLPTNEPVPTQQAISFQHQGMPDKQQASAFSSGSAQESQLIVSGNTVAEVQRLIIKTQNLLDLSLAREGTASGVKQRSRSLSLPSIQPGSTVKLATAAQIAMLGGGTTVTDGCGKNNNNAGGGISRGNNNQNVGVVSSLSSATAVPAVMVPYSISATAVTTAGLHPHQQTLIPGVVSQPTLLSIPPEQTTIIPATQQQQQQATFMSVSLPHVLPQQPSVVSVMSHIPVVSSSPHHQAATTTTLIPVVHHCFPSLLASYQHYQPATVPVSAPSSTTYHPPVIAPAPAPTSSHTATTSTVAAVKEHFTLTSLASSIQFVQSSLTSSSRILSSPLREFSSAAALAGAAVGVNLALPTNLAAGPILDAGGGKVPTKTIILDQMPPRLLLPTPTTSIQTEPPSQATTSSHQHFLTASFAGAPTLQQQQHQHHLALPQTLHEPLVSIEEVPSTAAIIEDIAEIEESSSKIAAAAAAAAAASGSDEASRSLTSLCSVVSNYSDGGGAVSKVVYGNLSLSSATNLSLSPSNIKRSHETKVTSLATTVPEHGATGLVHSVTATPPSSVSGGEKRGQTPLPNNSPNSVAVSPMGDGDFRQSLTILNMPSTCVPTTSQGNFIVNVSSGQVMTTCIPTTALGNSNTVTSIVRNSHPSFVASNNLVSPNSHLGSPASLDDDNSRHSNGVPDTYMGHDWRQSHVVIGGLSAAQQHLLEYERNTAQARDSTITSNENRDTSSTINQVQRFSPSLFVVSAGNDNTHPPVTVTKTLQTDPNANVYAKSASS